MLLVIQSVILCILFTLIILPPQYKNPISQVASYPPAIRKRVKILPEYKDSIKMEVEKQIIRKVFAVFLIATILAIVAYLSKARTFRTAFRHTFILFLVVNIYDVIVLDLIIFRNSKKLMIKGTEDMIEDYKDPMHHIKGGIIGIGLGFITSLMSGALVALFTLMV